MPGDVLLNVALAVAYWNSLISWFATGTDWPVAEMSSTYGLVRADEEDEEYENDPQLRNYSFFEIQ